jgi:hypothetical protein
MPHLRQPKKFTHFTAANPPRIYAAKLASSFLEVAVNTQLIGFVPSKNIVAQASRLCARLE